MHQCPPRQLRLQLCLGQCPPRQLSLQLCLHLQPLRQLRRREPRRKKRNPMEAELISLAIIMLVAFAAPLLANAIPGKPVPEVVFLVFAGALLGPNMAHLIHTDGSSLQLISELGMSFLFLLAGYEINPRCFVSRTGFHAGFSWIASFAIALVVAFAMGHLTEGDLGGIAFAITLTTTAYGTIAPIMKERGITDTAVGKAVTTYGSVGEILPILAMAFLLSARSTAATIVTLAVFVLFCALVAAMPAFARRTGSRLWHYLDASAGEGSRPLMRMIVLILIFLVALSAVFDLDMVLGAFAAGFIMQRIFPEGHGQIEDGIEAIGNGFFIPAFFVISGAAIDLASAFSSPLLLLADIALLVVVRGIMVSLSLRINKETRCMTWRENFSASAYCTMALPLIVAVTSAAVSVGTMQQDMASLLVTAGALTVLVIPVVTSLVRVTSDTFPAHARQAHARQAHAQADRDSAGHSAAARATSDGAQESRESQKARESRESQESQESQHMNLRAFARRTRAELRHAHNDFVNVRKRFREGETHMSSMEYLAVVDASLRAARQAAMAGIAGAAAEAAKLPPEERLKKLEELRRKIDQAAAEAGRDHTGEIQKARALALKHIEKAAQAPVPGGSSDADAGQAVPAEEPQDDAQSAQKPERAAQTGSEDQS